MIRYNLPETEICTGVIRYNLPETEICTGEIWLDQDQTISPSPISARMLCNSLKLCLTHDKRTSGTTHGSLIFSYLEIKTFIW